MRLLRILATGILLSLLSAPAIAQQVNNYWFTGTPGVSCPSCWVPVSSTNPLPVTGALSIAGTTSNASSGVATSSTNLPTVAYTYGFNGTTWDQLQVDASKNLKVNVVTGGGGSQVDASAWTTAVTSFAPSGGVFNDAATLSTGTQGTFRLTTKRAQIVDTDTSGNALYSAITAPVPCKAAATWNAQTGQTGTQPAGCDGSNAFWMDMGAWAGTALGAPSNYGTSPGAVAVPGVNAFVTNTVTIAGALTANQSVNESQINGVTPLMGNGVTGTGSQRVTIASDNSAIPTQGQVNVTATDCSGTVVTGGTAVNAFTAQATLHGFTIVNTDTTEVMWISFTTTAAASTAGSYPIPAATATTFAGGGSFTSPPGFGLNHALSVIATTSAHKFSCTWW